MATTPLADFRQLTRSLHSSHSQLRCYLVQQRCLRTADLSKLDEEAGELTGAYNSSTCIYILVLGGWHRSMAPATSAVKARQPYFALGCKAADCQQKRMSNNVSRRATQSQVATSNSRGEFTADSTWLFVCGQHMCILHCKSYRKDKQQIHD